MAGAAVLGKRYKERFGLVLDGSERVDEVVKSGLLWDVMGGVARRNWARNEHSMETSIEYNKTYQGESQITIPYLADEELVAKAVKEHFR